MKRFLQPVLASLLLLSACSSSNDTTTTPSSAPTKPIETPPAKSAESPKPPAATPPPAPLEVKKPPAEAPPPAPVEDTKPPADNPPAAPVESPKPPVSVDMDAAINELMAKPEQPDESIEIQHILISFQGAPRMPASVTRSKEEAKALAEKVYAEVVAGGDFDALVKQYTNDSPPGIYPLTQASRKGMVKSFGDVGFRLKVGEVGVAPWDAAASPFGWHIIKRLK